MAKRKRLSPLAAGTPEALPEPSAMQHYPLGVAPTVTRHAPPVAQIAAEAAARAALDELAAEMRAARDGGRLIVDLPLEAVEAAHLHRDRTLFAEEDMAALKASIADRGQQTPIEVVALPDTARFGLISGARRMAALRALRAETGEARFGQVQALVRPFGDAPGAYLAMVEENEIRADLSFYERGRLACEAARIGVFASPAAAVRALFVHAPPAKRSKILNFVSLYEALGPALRFGEAIPEKLGLALAKAIGADPGFAPWLAGRLAAAAPADAAAERAILDAAVQPAPPPEVDGRPAESAAAPRQEPTGSVTGAERSQAEPPSIETTEGSLTGEPAPGIRLHARPGRALLTGPGVTETLLADLADWLGRRG